MIKLSREWTVAAAEVSEINADDYGRITVWMKSGRGHSVDIDYGKGVYEKRSIGSGKRSMKSCALRLPV